MKLTKDDEVTFMYRDKMRTGVVNYTGVNKVDQSDYFNVAFEDGGKKVYKTFRNERVVNRRVFVAGKV